MLHVSEKGMLEVFFRYMLHLSLLLTPLIYYCWIKESQKRCQIFAGDERGEDDEDNAQDGDEEGENEGGEEGEEREADEDGSGSEKADSDREDDGEKSGGETSAKEGSDGGKCCIPNIISTQKNVWTMCINLRKARKSLLYIYIYIYIYIYNSNNRENSCWNSEEVSGSKRQIKVHTET